MKRALAAVSLVAVFVLRVGCAAGGAGAPPVDVAQGRAVGPPVAGQPEPLQVFSDGFGGKGTPLRNGSTVALGSGLSAALYLDPYPPAGISLWLDLYLSRDGRPQGDAEIVLQNEMVYMDHGSTQVKGNSAGDGHYLFALRFPMIGFWRQHITIRLTEETYQLPLMVTVTS